MAGRLYRESGGGGGAEDPAFVAFVLDDAIPVEVQWDAEGARCLNLSPYLAFINEQAMGKRSKEKEPLFSRKKATGWATQQEVLEYDIDTESMTIALPTQKVDDLRASSIVDNGAAVGNGAGGVSVSREAATRFLCDPAWTVFRPLDAAAF